MDATEFKEKAEDLLSQMEDLVHQMPQKGDTSSECQRMTLQIAVNEAYYAVAGTTDKDFIEDED